MKQWKSLALLISACLLLAGCACEHQYSEATCTELAACTICGETTGELAAHQYSEATCTEFATCAACGATTGELAAHQYSEATCTEFATCAVCGATTGELAAHQYSEATCTELATCAVCGATTGELAEHQYSEATCTELATCAVCGATTGELAAHQYSEATCEKAATCSVCGATKGSALGHKFKGATCVKEGVCSVCGAKGKKGSHSYKNGTCTVCGAADKNYAPPISAEKLRNLRIDILKTVRSGYVEVVDRYESMLAALEWFQNWVDSGNEASYVLAYANVTNAQKSFAKAQTYRKKAVEKCGNYAENRDMKEALEDEIAAWDDAISIELNSDDWVDWLVFLDLVPGSEASEATSKIAEAWGKEAG